MELGCVFILLHLVVVLETALKSPVHSATLNLRHFHLECPVFWGAENTWYSWTAKQRHFYAAVHIHIFYAVVHIDILRGSALGKIYAAMHIDNFFHVVQ